MANVEELIESIRSMYNSDIRTVLVPNRIAYMNRWYFGRANWIRMIHTEDMELVIYAYSTGFERTFQYLIIFMNDSITPTNDYVFLRDHQHSTHLMYHSFAGEQVYEEKMSIVHDVSAVAKPFISNCNTVLSKLFLRCGQPRDTAMLTIMGDRDYLKTVDTDIIYEVANKRLDVVRGMIVESVDVDTKCSASGGTAYTTITVSFVGNNVKYLVSMLTGKAPKVLADVGSLRGKRFHYIYLVQKRNIVRFEYFDFHLMCKDVGEARTLDILQYEYGRKVTISIHSNAGNMCAFLYNKVNKMRDIFTMHAVIRFQRLWRKWWYEPNDDGYVRFASRMYDKDAATSAPS